MRTRLATAVAAGGSLLCGLTGCGGEEAPEPSGRTMTAPAPVPAQERISNDAPEVTKVVVSPERPRPGDPITVVVEAEDPDGDGVRLEYRWSLNGRKLEETRPRLETRELEKGDRIQLQVLASDGRLESRPVTRRIELGNRGPVLTGIAFSNPQVIRAGEPVQAAVVASDPDGDPLRFSYTWFVNGQELRDAPDEPRFDTKELKRGDKLWVEVVARDAGEATEPVKSAEVRVGNTPPVFPGVPTPERVGDGFRYSFRATDADGDRSLRYGLKEGPPGMSIDPKTGVLSWSPGAGQAGKHMVEVTVVDSHGDGSAIRFPVIVNVEAAAPPPAAR